jgi:hypothetical protein
VSNNDYAANNYGYGQPSDWIPKILAKMEEFGISHIEASYSGGNDEGGINSVMATDDKGTPVELTEDRFIDTGETWGNGQPRMTYNEAALKSLLDSLLSTKYLSWAGDFEAHGTLYVSLKERRAWTQGEETTWQEESDPIQVEF